MGLGAAVAYYNFAQGGGRIDPVVDLQNQTMEISVSGEQFLFLPFKEYWSYIVLPGLFGLIQTPRIFGKFLKKFMFKNVISSTYTIHATKRKLSNIIKALFYVQQLS